MPLRIFTAPHTEPGYITLQAKTSTFLEVLTILQAKGQGTVFSNLRNRLQEIGVKINTKPENLLDDPHVRVRLEESVARDVLTAAGVSS